MSYRSTKHYGHEIGLSASFRQWRADSHCSFVHGYALAFTFTFEADVLDHRNWVVDFGGLDFLKQSLKASFDHKLVVAQDDPFIHSFKQLEQLNLCKLVIVPRVGCEAFAEMAFYLAERALKKIGQDDRVRVISCEVREHGANSGIYIPSQESKA